MRNRDNKMFVSFGRFIVNILWRERETAFCVERDREIERGACG